MMAYDECLSRELLLCYDGNMAEPAKNRNQIKIPKAVIFFAIMVILGLVYFTARRLTQGEPGNNANVSPAGNANQQNTNLNGNRNQNLNQGLVNANRGANTNVKNESTNSRL